MQTCRVNGLALAVWIYAAANISGGHLNPAVTFSTLICGFYPVLHSILYIALQIVGAIFGALLVAGLMPKTHIGMGDGAPGGKGHSTLTLPKVHDKHWHTDCGVVVAGRYSSSRGVDSPLPGYNKRSAEPSADNVSPRLCCQILAFA
jgi:hypothetical protein